MNKHTKNILSTIAFYVPTHLLVFASALILIVGIMGFENISSFDVETNKLLYFFFLSCPFQFIMIMTFFYSNFIFTTDFSRTQKITFLPVWVILLIINCLFGSIGQFIIFAPHGNDYGVIALSVLIFAAVALFGLAAARLFHALRAKVGEAISKTKIKILSWVGIGAFMYLICIAVSVALTFAFLMITEA